jgi:hypothetical protein
MNEQSRLRDIPRMKWGDTMITAARYNRIRLALRRLKSPIRFDTGLRDIDMILEENVWYCVDRSMHDLPIIAWDNFPTRMTLHEPICCRLSFYHAHADKILELVLTAVDTYLEQQLTPKQHYPAHVPSVFVRKSTTPKSS